MTVKQQRTTPRWTGGLSLVVIQSKSSLPNLCTVIIMDVEVRRLNLKVCVGEISEELQCCRLYNFRSVGLS